MTYQKIFTMQLEDKWGHKSLEMGWTAIPTALFLLQKELNLSPIQFNVLLNILLHWWGKDWPHPSQKSIANRIGMSPKTVQRAILSIEELGLIHKQRTSREHRKYNGRNIYDLSPLIKKLEDLMPIAKDLYSVDQVKQKIIIP